MDTQTYIFTGVSGTGVKGSLQKVQNLLGPLDTRLISIDDLTWKLFCSDARSNSAILGETDLEAEQVEEGRPPNWWLFLRLPIDRIRYYWQLAAREAEAEILAHKPRYALVTLHACYQGDDYRWRLSPVDPTLLMNLHPKAFFALIDDCFDVHARRFEDLGMERQSCVKLSNKWERVEKLVNVSVSRLIDIILWREEEIMFTDVLAASCRVPSHLFAIKHPIKTLTKLLTEPGISHYLSHPITSVRTDPGFPETASLHDIQEISRSIRDLLPSIEPTTIDEFRLQKVGTDDYLPFLNPRWPYLDSIDRLLYTTPATNPGDSICPPENIIALDVEKEFEELKAGKGPPQVRENIFSSLRQLMEAISADVTWRDHHLVDQTRRLIVFRPIFQGRVSGGVKREVDYYKKLFRTGAEVYPSVIFHPDHDEERLADETAHRILDTWRRHPLIGTSLVPIQRSGTPDEALAQEMAAEIRFASNIPVIARAIVDKLEKYYHIEPGIHDPAPMAQGRNLDGMMAAREVREEAKKKAVDVLKKNKYLVQILSDMEPLVSLAKSHDDLILWLKAQAGTPTQNIEDHEEVGA
jgi:hypothetical protein